MFICYAISVQAYKQYMGYNYTPTVVHASRLLKSGALHNSGFINKLFPSWDAIYTKEKSQKIGIITS
jgi:hypothetical protein